MQHIAGKGRERKENLSSRPRELTKWHIRVLQSYFNAVGGMRVIGFFRDICRTDLHPLGLCKFLLGWCTRRAAETYTADIYYGHSEEFTA